MIMVNTMSTARIGRVVRRVSLTQKTRYSTRMDTIPAWKPAAVARRLPLGRPCAAPHLSTGLRSWLTSCMGCCAASKHECMHWACKFGGLSGDHGKTAAWGCCAASQHECMQWACKRGGLSGDHGETAAWGCRAASQQALTPPSGEQSEACRQERLRQQCAPA